MTGPAGPGAPGPGTAQPGDPDPFRELRRVAREASDALAEAVSPERARRPAGAPEWPPYLDLLWQLTKALGFAAPDPVPDEETWEATADAAQDAAAAARRLQAAGLSTQEATVRAEDRAILWMDDVGSIAGLDLTYTPPDADQTLRTLQVRITVVPGQPLVEVLGADRGAAPVARPATAADVLELGAAIERIATVVARLTAEPPADGLPAPTAGTAGATVVCQLCGRTVPAAAGRRVVVGPGSRPATACSVAHARALYAGEGDVDAGGSPQ